VKAHNRTVRVAKFGSRGQSLVEAAVVLMVFFALLLGVIDCGQVLIAHQSLVERVRGAVRWGVVHPWDDSGPDAITNLILYDQTGEPRESTAGFLGLKRANVLVSLIVLPLAMPLLIFGAGATDRAIAGTSAAGALYLLGALCVLTCTLAPFAAAAALRISLE